MKLIDKITSEKGFKGVIAVCCMIVTLAVLFSIGTSFVQRNKMNEHINDVRGELGWVNSRLNKIDTSVDGVKDELSDVKYLRSIDSHLTYIGECLYFISTRR